MIINSKINPSLKVIYSYFLRKNYELDDDITGKALIFTSFLMLYQGNSLEFIRKYAKYNTIIKHLANNCDDNYKIKWYNLYADKIKGQKNEYVFGC
jgi:hypothetical protein